MSIGGILALLVLLFAVLMAAGVIPFTALWVGGLIAALCVAVFCAGFPLGWRAAG